MCVCVCISKTTLCMTLMVERAARMVRPNLALIACYRCNNSFVASLDVCKCRHYSIWKETQLKWTAILQLEVQCIKSPGNSLKWCLNSLFSVYCQA